MSTNVSWADEKGIRKVCWFTTLSNDKKKKKRGTDDPPANWERE